MKRILLIGSQHGTEILGDLLHDYIKTKRKGLLPHITFKIGNIRAKKAGVRYIETDMNRSYGTSRKTYEERRAARMKRYIAAGQFDLILDLHTTTCDQPPSLIVAKLDTAATKFVRASSIHRVVHMRHPLVKTSLIGIFDHSVVIEINKDEVDTKTLEGLCDDIDRYLRGEVLPEERHVYEVQHLLEKTELTEEQADTLVNFEMSEHGFAPILTGNNSYKHNTNYLGFKAYNVYRCAI